MIKLILAVANSKDEIARGEDVWRQAVRPQSYGIEPVRSWGWQDLQRPDDLPTDAVWDWAGVEGQFLGSYAYLEWVTRCFGGRILLMWPATRTGCL